MAITIGLDQRHGNYERAKIDDFFVAVATFPGGDRSTIAGT